jgi:hypothetical protein
MCSSLFPVIDLEFAEGKSRKKRIDSKMVDVPFGQLRETQSEQTQRFKVAEYNHLWPMAD